MSRTGQPTAADTVRAVAARLTASGRVASPHAEARTLVAHVLSIEPNQVPIAPGVDERQRALLDDLAARRVRGEPLQHLTGVAYFRRISVAVGPGVFIPRPETEVMTGWVIDHVRALAERQAAPVIVVELCAGSGAISAALADELAGLEVAIHAVELSAEALPYARRSLASTDVELVEGDMADAFSELNERVDVVVANPPYIPLDAFAAVPAEVRDHDPALALFSGADGLDALRVVARVAARLLKPGGFVVAEHADVQGASAPEVFVRQGAFDQVRDEVDLTSRPRFVRARRRTGMAGYRM